MTEIDRSGDRRPSKGKQYSYPSGGSGGGGDSNASSSQTATSQSSQQQPYNPALHSGVVTPDVRHTSIVRQNTQSSGGYVSSSVLAGQPTETDKRIAEAQARQKTTSQIVRAETTPQKKVSSGGSSLSGIIPQSYAVSQAIAQAEKDNRQARIPEKNTIVIREEEREGVTYKLPKPLVLTEKQAVVRKEQQKKQRRYQQLQELQQAGSDYLMVIPLPIPGGGKTRVASKTVRGVVGAIKSEAPAIIERGVGALGKAKAVPGVKYLASGAVALGEGYLVTKGVSEGSRLVTPKESRELLQNPAFQEAVTKAQEKALSQSYDKAWYKGLAAELPMIGATQNLPGFDVAVTEELKAAGFQGEQLEKAKDLAFGERLSRSFAETGGLVTVSKAAEKIGRRAVGEAFEKAAPVAAKKISFETFKKTAPQIAKAGVVEGVGTEVVMSTARENKKPLLPSNARDLLPSWERSEEGKITGIKTEARITDMIGYGVAGGISAGVIGGIISAGTVAKSATGQTFGKIVEYGAYFSDPLEKPGDILEDISEGVFKVTSKVYPKKPTITKVVNPQDVASFGVTQQKGKPPTKQKPSPVYAFSVTQETPTGVPTTLPSITGKKASNVMEGPTVVPPSFTPPTNKISKSPIPGPPLPAITPPTTKKSGKGPSSFLPTFVTTPAQTPTVPVTPTTVSVPTVVPVNPFPISPDVIPSIPTSPNTQTPVNPITDVPTNPLTDIPTAPEVPITPEVPIPVTPTVPVNVPINIPALTPLMRVPPPILPQWPGTGRGAGTGKGKRLKYVNELATSQSLLGDLAQSPNNNKSLWGIPVPSKQNLKTGVLDMKTRKQEYLDIPNISGFAFGPRMGKKNGKKKKKKRSAIFPSIF